MSELNAQQPDGGAEDAFDKWIHEDHFGVGCEIGMNDVAHSEECVEAAFRDGYAAGQRANTLPAAPEREAETAIDWLDQLVRDGIGAVEFCLTEDGHIGIWVGSQSEEERALATGDTVSECIEAVARKESSNAE